MPDPFPDTSLGFRYKKVSLSPHLTDGETEVSVGRAEVPAGGVEWGLAPGLHPGTPVHSRPASCPRGTAVRPGALDICRPEPGGRGPPLHRASHPEPPLPLTSGAGSNLACLLGHMQRDTHLYTCTRMHTHHSEGPRPGKSKHLLQGKQQARLPREKMWPNQTQAACGPRSRCYPRVTMASRVWW